MHLIKEGHDLMWFSFSIILSGNLFFLCASKLHIALLFVWTKAVLIYVVCFLRFEWNFEQTQLKSLTFKLSKTQLNIDSCQLSFSRIPLFSSACLLFYEFQKKEYSAKKMAKIRQLSDYHKVISYFNDFFTVYSDFLQF